MGKSTRKGKGKALPQTVEEPLQSIPETPQEEKASWGVPAIDPTANSGVGGWGNPDHEEWVGDHDDDAGVPGTWGADPAERPHPQSPVSATSPQTLIVSPRSYASPKLDSQPPSIKDYAPQHPMGLQQPPMGLQQPPAPTHGWDYPTKPSIPPAPAPAPAHTLRPSRQSSKTSKRAQAQAQAPRSAYNAPAYTAAPAYTSPAAYNVPATAAYAAPGTGRGAGFSSWQNWAAEVGMAPPAQQQTHVKFASHSTHIPSTVPSATMQQAQATRSAWKTSGMGRQAQAAPVANNGWGGAGGGGGAGWDTGGQGQGWGETEQQGWGANEQQGWGAKQYDEWDEGNGGGGGWDDRDRGDDEWGDGWDEGGGDQWDKGGGGWDNEGGGDGDWGREDDGGWQDWPADTGKGGAWADTGAEPKAPPQSGHNDGWQNWGKNGGHRSQSYEHQRTSQHRYWSPSPAGLDDRPISHTMAYATGSPTSLKKTQRYSSDGHRTSISVPPGWTLANKGMDLYKTGKFALADNGEILVTLDAPLFGRERLAKDRLRWLFPADKDKRVGTTLRWIKDVEHGLGAFALDVYLARHERGALIINAATFYPPVPIFDWLSYHDAKETLDKRMQESIVTYDPTKHAIVMVFLPSPSGNSAAVWRRRVEVPGSARSTHKREIRKKPKVIVEKTVFVDELTKPEDAKKRKRKKQGFWKRLFGGIKIVW